MLSPLPLSCFLEAEAWMVYLRLLACSCGNNKWLEESSMYEGLGMLLGNMKIICAVDDETVKVDG